MATVSSLQLNDEEKNFIKFFILNFKVSPNVVRKYFDTVFQPISLSVIINQHMQKILNLINKKRINATQENILRGIPGTTWPYGNPAPLPGSTGTSSDDFDLTLMICLLRNLGSIHPPSSGWDRLPSRNEKTIGAYLARLKFYRNWLAHSTVSTIASNDFQDMWTEVEEALIHLNGGQRLPEVDDILKHDLDTSNGNIQLELETLKEDYKEFEMKMTSVIASEQQIRSEFDHYKKGNLPKNIADNILKLVNTWEKDDIYYFEASRCKTFMEKLKQICHVTVTGNSGSGKTALVRHAALSLKKEAGFSIVPVETPEQILQYKTNVKQIFIVDDVLGRYSIDLSLLNAWERMNEKLKECIKDGNDVKVICTLRNQVANTKKFKKSDSVLRINLYDLEDRSASLSRIEKRQIFLNHLHNSEIETVIQSEEIDSICENSFAFPLLCKLVTNNEERFKHRLDFFRSPHQLFGNELDRLSNGCPHDYFTLVICMLFGGKIDLSELRSDNNKETLREISESCGLEGNISEKGIIDSKERLEGSFIISTENGFKFIHDKLLESVSYHFTSNEQRLMFSVCPFSFITERVRVGAKLPDDDETIVIANKSSFECLAKRVFLEIQSGRFLNVLISQLVSNIEFVNYFDTFLKEHYQSSYIYFKLLKTICIHSENITSAIKNYLTNSQKRSNLVNKDAIDHVIRSFNSRSRLIHWTVAFGRDKLFCCLWDGLSKSQKQTLLGRDTFFPLSKPLLPLAVLGGNQNIIETLLNAKADVNSYSENGISVLSVALKASQCDIVSMLISRGANVDKGDIFEQTTPLLACIHYGNLEMFELVLGANVRTTRRLIHAATLSYDLYTNINVSKEMLYSFLQKDNGNTELHSAVLNRVQNSSKSAIESIGVRYLASENDNGLTVLHLTVLFGDLEMMDDVLQECRRTKTKFCFLCRHTGSVNTGDVNGIRPLHLAVIRSDYNSVDKLLRYGASSKSQDLFGRTPGHFVRCPQIAKRLFSLQSTENVTWTENDSIIDTHRNNCVNSKESAIQDLKLTSDEKPFETKLSFQSNLSSSEEKKPFRDLQTRENVDESKINQIGGTINMAKILGSILLNVLFACLPPFLLSLQSKFIKIVNCGDKNGNTPVHEVAKRLSGPCDDSDAYILDILLKNDGNVYLRNREGKMPYDLAKYQSERVSDLKPNKKYFFAEKIFLSVTGLLSLIISLMFCYLSYTFHLNRELTLPNHQQECLVEMIDRTDSQNTSFRLKISQENLSKPFDVIFPIFLFFVPYIIMHGRLKIVKCLGTKFILYFTCLQVLKLFSYILFIMSIVYIETYASETDFLPFMQFLFIYLFFIDFKGLQLLKDDKTDSFWKFLVLLITSVLYVVLLIVSLTQVNLIYLNSIRWEKEVNCKGPVAVQGNNSIYDCEIIDFYDNNHINSLHVISDREYVNSLNTPAKLQLGNNSTFCLGLKTATETAYSNILYNMYSSVLAFISVQFYFYALKGVLFLTLISFQIYFNNRLASNNIKWGINIILKFQTVFIILFDCIFLYVEYTIMMHVVNSSN